MEDFSILINFALGSQQMINVPNFCQNGNWAVYVEEFNADVNWCLTGSPQNSWVSIGYRRPYFNILIDQPGKIFDAYGKPLSILAIASPASLINNTSGNVNAGYNTLHYSVTDDSFFNMIPISNIQQFLVTLADPVDNSPLVIIGNIPNQTLKMEDNEPHYWSGGICKLRLHKLQ